jgi:predicted Zn-dependent peptidase
MPAELAYPGPLLRHTRTSSGLMVAVHDPGPEVSVFSITLVVPWGSAHDPPGMVGAAFATSVMFSHAGLLEADGGWDGASFSRWLEGHGVDRHAETYPEHLVFSMHGPASMASEITRRFCGLVYRPFMDPEAASRTVQDVMQADDDRAAGGASLAQEVLTQTLFEGHPLGRPAVPADGVPSAEQLGAHLRAVTSEPWRSLLLLATHDTATALVDAEACAPPPAATATLPAMPPVAAAAPGGHLRRVGMTAFNQGTVFIRVGGRAPPAGSRELAALHVALETLANGFSSSLVTQLRTERGLVYGVEGGILTTRSGASWYLGTSTSEANAPEVVDVITRTLENIRGQGVSPVEWKRLARASALGFAQGADNLEGLMATEAEHFRLGLAPGESWGTPRLWWSMDEAWAARVASRWLDPNESVLVLVATAEALEGPLAGLLDERLDSDAWPP